MVFIIISMLVCLVVAGGVVLYVAYPHRGEQIPRAEWLSRLLGKVQQAPTLTEWESDVLYNAQREALAESGSTSRS